MKRTEGWFKVYGYMVLVEGGVVVRGLRCDLGWKATTLYPYKACRTGGWDRAYDMSLTSFRAAVRRGTAALK